jgi:hypothetical protein
MADAAAGGVGGIAPLKALRALRKAQIGEARASVSAFTEFALTDEATGRRITNAPFHRAWQAHFDANRLAVLIAPVEHGKTQQIVARLLFALGNNPALRIGLISNTSSQAEKVLRQVRSHIERNAAVRAVFPSLVPSDHEEDPWHSSAITVQRKTRAKDPSVQALGVFGQVVGSRLDMIVLDDVLDFENTRTEEQRTKLVEWFDTSVLTRLTDGGCVFCIGTPWHQDDLLGALATRPGFKALRYSAVANPDADPTDWKPLWPEVWSVARLVERAANTLESVFQRKYLCRVRLDASARFKQVWIDRMTQLGKGLTFYAEAPKAQGGVRSLPCFTGVDLGIGLGDSDALTVLFTLALRDDARRLVVNIEAGRWQAPEILDRIVSHYRRYSSVIYVESNAAQAFITQLASQQVPVAAFHTGANKWDEEWGVESLAVEMRGMQWVLPSGATGEAVPPEARAWIREMLYYSPGAHTGDRLMASWLAREALRRFAAPKRTRLDLQSR